ncbi:P-loop containing nucleoside triphosphate hydrolase protein [Phyllosticta citrichinensis]|uniref:P-loop containing nucleoside triphosphate hydrolase protein n=1 Tax=Phyllosticta citrichinensis TaxID=1130410 RepID=A0ABR1XS51_9PEZI
MPDNYRDQYTPKPLTDVFTHDTDIDRRQCKRVVPMKVLCLGLGRTGTASLRDALKELGLNDTYHMMSVSVENPPDALFWMDALRAKYDGVGSFGREEWDQLLGHCQSVCDWPAIAFVKELVEAYPEAKVILTTRDVDSWHASTLKTVDWRANDPELKMVGKWDWGAGLYQPMLHKFWTNFFKGDFKKHGKQVFIDHYADVRALVPPERLLEYRMGQGWEPLCDFLEVPVPDKKFPHTNDTDGFVERCRGRNRAQMMNVALRALVVGGGVAATVLASTMTLHKFFGHRLLAGH